MTWPPCFQPTFGGPYVGPFGPPWPEHIQQTVYNSNLGYPALGNLGPRRSAPAEVGYTAYNPLLRQWEQHGVKARRGFKPKMYFTRPSDGKRQGALGRLKDVVQGEGADVFITSSGDKRTLMRDRPQRHQWSGWDQTNQERWERQMFDRDWRLQDEMPVLETSWTSRARSGEPGGRYNFHNRRFQNDETLERRRWDQVWTDARWEPGAKRRDQMPLSVRDRNYDWQTMVPWWAGMYPGGRPTR